MTRRLPHALAALSLLLILPGHPGHAASGPSTAAIAQLACDAQSLPETAAQGRVPASDVTSGRSAKGYSCNTYPVAHYGDTGGFQVHRYVDATGHDCAFYDSTLLFPKDVLTNATRGLGVFVLDMQDPKHPVHTATLTSPAMLSPHESLRLNVKRGLLAADMGSPFTQAGFVDVYSVAEDCRHPELMSSTPIGVLGHESAFSPDGTVFYVTSTGGHTLAAIDLKNPRQPAMLWFSPAYAAHGMSVSDDGNRLYIADTGAGLIILDVSRINRHEVNPTVPEISRLTWPEMSIPQNALPFTRNGHHYLLEVDEYTNTTTSPGATYTATVPPYDPTAKVGAARVIDIENEKTPFVLSNIRLAVNQTSSRRGDQQNDPGAKSPVQGYAGHYCALPTRTNPDYVACSFIVSGLRVFNLKAPAHPFQMGYYNAPTTPSLPMIEGNFAMSAPAFVPARREIWYTDGFSGFYVVRLTPKAFTHGPLVPARLR